MNSRVYASSWRVHDDEDIFWRAYIHIEQGNATTASKPSRNVKQFASSIWNYFSISLSSIQVTWERLGAWMDVLEKGEEESKESDDLDSSDAEVDPQVLKYHSKRDIDFRMYYLQQTKFLSLSVFLLNFLFLTGFILAVPLLSYRVKDSFYDSKYSMSIHVIIWYLFCCMTMCFYLALIVGYWGGDPHPQTRRRILRWVDVIGHSILIYRVLVLLSSITYALTEQEQCIMNQILSPSDPTFRFASFLIIIEAYQMFAISMLPLRFPWIQLLGTIEMILHISRILTCSQRIGSEVGHRFYIAVALLIAAFYVYIAMIPASRFEESIYSSYQVLRMLGKASVEKKGLVNVLCADLKVPLQSLRQQMEEYVAHLLPRRSKKNSDLLLQANERSLTSVAFVIDHMLCLMRIQEGRFRFRLIDSVNLFYITQSIISNLHSCHGLPATHELCQWTRVCISPLLLQSASKGVVTNKACLCLLLFFGLSALVTQTRDVFLTKLQSSQQQLQQQRQQQDGHSGHVEQEEKMYWIEMEPGAYIDDRFQELDIHTAPAPSRGGYGGRHHAPMKVGRRRWLRISMKTSATCLMGNNGLPHEQEYFQSCLMICKYVVNTFQGVLECWPMLGKISVAIPYAELMDKDRMNCCNRGVGVSVSNSCRSPSQDGSSSLRSIRSLRSVTGITSSTDDLSTPATVVRAYNREEEEQEIAGSATPSMLHGTRSREEEFSGTYDDLPVLHSSLLSEICVYSEDGYLHRSMILEIIDILGGGHDHREHPADGFDGEGGTIPLFTQLNMADLQIRSIIIVTTLSSCHELRRKKFFGLIILLSDRLAYYDDQERSVFDYSLSLPYTMEEVMDFIRYLNEYHGTLLHHHGVEDGDDSGQTNETSPAQQFATRSQDAMGIVATGLLGASHLDLCGLMTATHLRLSSWMEMIIPSIPPSQHLNYLRWLRINPSHSFYHKTWYVDFIVVSLCGFSLLTLIANENQRSPYVILGALPIVFIIIIRLLPVKTITVMGDHLLIYYRIFNITFLVLAIVVVGSLFISIEHSSAGGYHLQSNLGSPHEQDTRQSNDPEQSTHSTGFNTFMKSHYGHVHGSAFLVFILSYPIRARGMLDILSWPYNLISTSFLGVMGLFFFLRIIGPLLILQARNMYFVLLLVINVTLLVSVFLTEVIQRDAFRTLHRYILARDFLDRCIHICWMITDHPLQNINALQEVILRNIREDVLSCTIELHPVLIESMERTCLQLSKTRGLLQELRMSVDHEVGAMISPGQHGVSNAGPQSAGSELQSTRAKLIVNMEGTLLPVIAERICSLFVINTDEMRIHVSIKVHPEVMFVKCDPILLSSVLTRACTFCTKRIMSSIRLARQQPREGHIHAAMAMEDGLHTNNHEILVIISPERSQEHLKFTDIRMLHVLVLDTVDEACLGSTMSAADPLQLNHSGGHGAEARHSDHSSSHNEQPSSSSSSSSSSVSSSSTLAMAGGSDSSDLSPSLQQDTYRRNLYIRYMKQFQLTAICDLQPLVADCHRAYSYKYMQRVGVPYRLSMHSHRIASLFQHKPSSMVMHKMDIDRSSQGTHWMCWKRYGSSYRKLWLENHHRTSSSRRSPSSSPSHSSTFLSSSSTCATRLFTSPSLSPSPSPSFTATNRGRGNSSYSKSIPISTFNYDSFGGGNIDDDLGDNDAPSPWMESSLVMTLLTCKYQRRSMAVKSTAYHRSGWDRRIEMIGLDLPNPIIFAQSDCILVDINLISLDDWKGIDSSQCVEMQGLNEMDRAKKLLASRSSMYLQDLVLYCRCHGFQGMIALLIKSNMEICGHRLSSSRITESTPDITLPDSFVMLPLVERDLIALRLSCQRRMIGYCLPSI